MVLSNAEVLAIGGMRITPVLKARSQSNAGDNNIQLQAHLQDGDRRLEARQCHHCVDNIIPNRRLRVHAHNDVLQGDQ